MTITTEQVATFLGGGIVVFLLEQVIAQFRRQRNSLGYIIDTRMLAERSHPDLKISYKGFEVERVYSHRVTLRNVGNTALKDVPAYVIPSSGSLVFYEITAAPGIHCTVLTNEPPLAFSFNLLNPNETIQVQMVVLDSTGPSITVGARSEQLRVRDLSNVTSVSAALEVVADASSGVPGMWSIVKLLQAVAKIKE